MSANLSRNVSGEVEMFSGSNVVPWHKEGTIVKGRLTSAEAIRAAKLDWVAGEKPVVVEGAVVPDYKAIVRPDNDIVLSIMKQRYHIIQNHNAFEFFDLLVGDEEAFYETAGALDDGRVIWIQAQIPGEYFICGDKVERSLLLVNSFDGRYSLMVQAVSVRVVCANTLALALRGASNQVKIRHCQNYKQKIEQSKIVLGMVGDYFSTLSDTLSQLGERKMDKTEMELFTKVLLPGKIDENGDTSTRTENMRGTIVALFERGVGNEGKTRWDGLNAVTEFVDHERSTRGDNGRLETVLFGSGAKLKQRATNLLLETEDFAALAKSTSNN